MLIAEDVVLLVLDPARGTRLWSCDLPSALAGALLADLALVGCIEAEQPRWHKDPVRVVGDPPDDPLLADVAARVEAAGKPPQTLVGLLARDLQDRVLERLVEREVLRRDKPRLGGPRWPAIDTSRRDAVVADLVAVLVRDEKPTPRTAHLVALLSAIGVAGRLVEDQGVDHTDLARRAREIERSLWTGLAVRGD